MLKQRELRKVRTRKDLGRHKKARGRIQPVMTFGDGFWLSTHLLRIKDRRFRALLTLDHSNATASFVIVEIKLHYLWSLWLTKLATMHRLVGLKGFKEG